MCVWIGDHLLHCEHANVHVQGKGWAQHLSVHICVLCVNCKHASVIQWWVSAWWEYLSVPTYMCKFLDKFVWVNAWTCLVSVWMFQHVYIRENVCDNLHVSGLMGKSVTLCVNSGLVIFCTHLQEFVNICMYVRVIMCSEYVFMWPC